MSSKAISEATGKDIINRHLGAGTVTVPCRYVSITEDTDWDETIARNRWLESERLVVKPDQLIKRRGKLGLVGVNKSAGDVRRWVAERMNKEQQVGSTVGKLRTFIVEPFVKHDVTEEMYICISSGRDGDTILFHHQGGVDVGDVDALAARLSVPIDKTPTDAEIEASLLSKVTSNKKKQLVPFVRSLYNLYVRLHFTYLEINPIVVTADKIYILDLAAKLDQTADFICASQWGEVAFPPPFGRDAYPEEAYIADLDAKSGASLKVMLHSIIQLDS